MSQEIEVTLPKLGESIMNAKVVQWFKKEGESIKKDEALLEVATDKVNSEIPSPVAGVVKKIHAPADSDLTVGDPLALIETSDAAISETIQERSAATSAAGETSEDKAGFFSPAVLREARERGITLETLGSIKGTGSGGRVTKKDLENHAAHKPCPAKTPPPFQISGEVERVKMTGMRKAIADNIVRSFYEAPHASLIAEVDITNVMKVIKKEKEAFIKKHGAKLSITSFVARAISRAVKEFPFINSSLEEDTIVVKRFVNLGIAVSVEQGIMVPVVKQCQTLHLSDIAKQISVLSHKARTGILAPEEVQEGSITMTNFGMSGIQIGIPIIRYPEVAIIGVGATERKVVPLEGDLFGVRSVLHISLTFDHRVLDGMYGCGFLAAVKKHLEEDQTID